VGQYINLFLQKKQRKIMQKVIFNDRELKEIIGAGLGKLDQVVGSTIGPNGRYVMLEGRVKGLPVITKDGVSVAREMWSSDPIEDMAIQHVKMVAQRNLEKTGDGTTTATLMTTGIYSELLKGYLGTDKKISLVQVRNGMNAAKKLILEGIEKHTTKVTTVEEAKRIAKISANNDDEIGNLIGKGLEEVGLQSRIIIEESTTNKDTVETIDGMSIRTGFASPMFITDQEKRTIVCENPLIFISDEKVFNFTKSLLALFNSIVKNEDVRNRPVVLIVDEYSDDIVNTLVLNKVNQILDVTIVDAPSFGVERYEMLKDIAIATGANFISPSVNKRITDATLADAGTAEKIIIKDKETTFVKCGGQKIDIKERIKAVKAQQDGCTEARDLERFEARLANLEGGLVTIRVGADSAAELKEKKDRLEDALGATKAAIEEGYIAGGGSCIAQIVCSDILIKEHVTGDEDYRYGFTAVLNGVLNPMKRIIENSSSDYADIISTFIDVVTYRERDMLDNYGFDSLNGIFCDMIKSGIIDPSKVEKTAVETAVSTALILYSTDNSILGKKLAELK
jgi:chaperonin GroEL